jgi:hypothetical protein
MAASFKLPKELCKILFRMYHPVIVQEAILTAQYIVGAHSKRIGDLVNL